VEKIHQERYTNVSIVIILYVMNALTFAKNAENIYVMDAIRIIRRIAVK
jgi:hypothetical protein